MRSEIRCNLLHGTEEVLVVDAEKAVLELCERLIVSLGYNVISAATPESAIGYFAADPDYFDLVITDFSLLHLKGGQLSTIISEIRPNLPIILHTGSGEPAYQTGVIRKVIQKPASIHHLAAAIREVLDNE